jgi:ABC-type dipeptide/oligopeptide/nickel transport system permease subunit
MKSEARNPKSETNPKSQIPNPNPRAGSVVRRSGLFSDFGFRISGFAVNPRLLAGGLALTIILGACIATLPWTARDLPQQLDEDGFPLNIHNPFYYDGQDMEQSWDAPSTGHLIDWFGRDELGRPMLSRCLLGGCISLAIGTAAAAIAVTLGVSVGLFAGFRGGWIDGLLMRTVDIMYGLPYILLIILFKIALETPLQHWLGSPRMANLVVLFLAIGLVSWLTMARVVRGQVLSLRTLPFIEAARATGVPEWRIFLRHLLPNLIGPIIVYATLTVPQAILQESFLSFLGIGIAAPMPTWGSLAADGLTPGLNPLEPRWWALLFPCILLVVTLLSLNFLGDGLRDWLDPKREAAKI